MESMRRPTLPLAAIGAAVAADAEKNPHGNNRRARRKLKAEQCRASKKFKPIPLTEEQVRNAWSAQLPADKAPPTRPGMSLQC